MCYRKLKKMCVRALSGILLTAMLLSQDGAAVLAAGMAADVSANAADVSASTADVSANAVDVSGNAADVESATEISGNAAALEAFYAEFGEPVVDEKAYELLGAGTDNDEYLVDKSFDYRVAGVSAQPGRNSADISYYINEYCNAYMYVIYAESGSGLKFFPGETSVSDISAYQSASRWYSQSGRNANVISLTGLKADTAYLYRLAIRQGDESSGYTYHFVTKPATFTVKSDLTQTQITISDVEVTEYGYSAESISFKVNNPENESIVFVDVADAGSEAETSQSVYPSTVQVTNFGDGDYYIGSHIPTNEGAKEIRVAVYVGEKLTFVRQGIELKKRDASAVTASLSKSEGEMSLTVFASVSPVYDQTEDFSWTLYYRRSGEETYTENSAKNLDVGLGIYIQDEEENTTFEYYAVIRDAAGTILDSMGSESEPCTYTSGQLVTYTKAHFKDPAIYQYLLAVDTDGVLTNKDLETTGGLGTASNSNNGFQEIEWPASGPAISLEDLPEKLPNLTSVNLSHNKLTDISPLLKLTHLRSVDLTYNDIETLPNLSACGWNYIRLEGNLLSEEAIASAGIPKETDCIVGSQDTDNLTMDETQYIYQSKHQLEFSYDHWYGIGPNAETERKYTVTVQANGNTSEALTPINAAGSFYLSDIGDLHLTPGITYPATVTLTDNWGTLATGNMNLRYAEATDPTGGYVTEHYVNYISYADIESRTSASTWGLIARLAIGYTREEIASLKLMKDGEVLQTASERITVDPVSHTHDASYSGQNTSYISYSGISIQAPFSLKGLEPGNYSLLVALTDGTEYSVKDSVVITSDPMVSYGTPVAANGYDSTGDYYYVAITGYNLDPSKIYPVIVDEDGNEYTSPVSGNVSGDSSHSYLFKLKKEDNWTALQTADNSMQVSLKLVTAEGYTVIDNRANKSVTVNNLKAESVGGQLKKAYYNSARGSFEYYFTADVPVGTYVEGRLYTAFSGGTLLATAEGEITTKHRALLSYKTPAGETYVPTENQTVYHKLFVPGCNSMTTSTYISAGNEMRDSILVPGVPCTVEIYHCGDAETVLKTLNITEESLDSGHQYYYFTDQDLQGLYKDEMYRLLIFTPEGTKNYVDCFLPARENAPADDSGQGGGNTEDDPTDYEDPEDETIDEGDQSEDGIKAESLTLSEKEMTLLIGQKTVLKSSLAPEGVTNGEITWKSSDNSIVTVTQDGKLTAVGIGTAFITARSASNTAVKDVCKVTVMAPVTKLMLNQTKITLGVGKFATLHATATSADASVAENPEVEWSSSNKAVADVDSATGLITARSVGSAKITALAKDGSGKKAVCTVKVGPSVDKVVISSAKNATSVEAGKTLKLTAKIEPAKAAIKTVTWSSSNTDIATVDAKGTVTGIAAGTVTVSATAPEEVGGTVGTFALTVTEASRADAVTGLKVMSGRNEITEATNLTLAAGKSMTLKAAVAEGKAKDVIFTTSDPEIVSVTAKGKVTGLKEGDAEIKLLSLKDPSIYVTAKVTVVYPVKKITLNTTKASLGVGKTGTLSIAAFSPAQPTDCKVEWSSNSSDVLVACMSEGKRIEDLEFGPTAETEEGDFLVYKAINPTKRAVITASSHDGNKKAKCTVSVTGSVTALTLKTSKQITDKGTDTDGTPVYEMALKAGKSASVKPQIAAEYGADKSLSYRSNHASVASVNAKGKITVSKQASVGDTASVIIATSDGQKKIRLNIVVVK